MSGVRLTLPEQDLPSAVADVRKRVFDAAMACDYDTLEQIALEKGAGFTFSYGSGTDASEYWRDLEENSTATPKPMRALADDPDAAASPATSRAPTPGPPPTTRTRPRTTGARSSTPGSTDAEEIDQMKTQGTGYLGYRTAITPDGDWQFFVAGD